MAKIVVVAGKSASGKSTAYCQIDLPEEKIHIKGLNPKETFLFNVVDKELPVPSGSYDKLRIIKDETGKAKAVGNMVVGWDYKNIIQVLEKVNNKKEIKNIIIEDAQYLLSMDFFDRRMQTGYDKYAQMGFSFVDLLMNVLRKMRDDIIVFIIMHTDEYKEEKEMFIKLKTIGKMLDEKFTIEGLFTTVLVAQRKLEGKKMKYTFRTRPKHENDIAKSLLGMFLDENGKIQSEIPNDFGIIRDALVKYYKLN